MPFYFGRWAVAALWLLWLGLSILAAYQTAQTWWGRLLLGVFMLSAGLVVWLVIRLFSRLLAIVFVEPIRWALARRGGIQHGTARWARRSAVLELAEQRGPIYLGRWRDPLSARDHTLTADGTRSIFALGTSRSGKTSSLIVPAALEWPASCVVHDIKGELFTLTHRHRQKLGPVYRFAPGEMDSCAFNPLDAIRADHQVGDALNIANVLSEGDGPLAADAIHWTALARDILAGTILYCRQRNPAAGLGDVLQALGEAKLFEQMAVDTQPMVSGVGQAQCARSEREASSARSAAVRYLLPWRDDYVCRNTSRSDFELDELCDDSAPASLYLCTAAADSARLATVQRLLLSTIVTHLMSRDIKFDDGRPLPAWRHRMLLLIDELAALGHSSVLELALSRLAGYGCAAILAVQSMRQIEQAYGQSASITTNAPIRLVFGVAETSDAEWVSAQLGTATASIEQRSRHGLRLGLGGSTSVATAFNSRPLMTPGEILSRDPESVLVIGATRNPIAARRLKYWEDPVMAARVADRQEELRLLPSPFPQLPPPWADQRKPIGRAVMAFLAIALPATGLWWSGIIPLSSKPLPAVHVSVPAAVKHAGAMADALPAFGDFVGAGNSEHPVPTADDDYAATMRRLCANTGKAAPGACKSFQGEGR